MFLPFMREREKSAGMNVQYKEHVYNIRFCVRKNLKCSSCIVPYFYQKL